MSLGFRFPVMSIDVCFVAHVVGVRVHASTDEEGGSGQVNWGILTDSGDQMQEGVVQAQQEGTQAGEGSRQAGTMRFECAGRHMSAPTTEVQISACHIFYKAGIRCVLVLGRYRYNNSFIGFVCFQVHTSSQNHVMQMGRI